VRCTRPSWRREPGNRRPRPDDRPRARAAGDRGFLHRVGPARGRGARSHPGAGALREAARGLEPERVHLGREVWGSTRRSVAWRAGTGTDPVRVAPRSRHGRRKDPGGTAGSRSRPRGGDRAGAREPSVPVGVGSPACTRVGAASLRKAARPIRHGGRYGSRFGGASRFTFRRSPLSCGAVLRLSGRGGAASSREKEKA
jgi:hypothetical protein